MPETWNPHDVPSHGWPQPGTRRMPPAANGYEYAPPPSGPPPSRRGRRSTLVAGLIVTGLLVAVAASSLLATRGPTNPTDAGAETSILLSPLTEDGVRDSTPYANELTAYVSHLSTWWTEQMPVVHGVEFGDLEGGLIPSTGSTALPDCAPSAFGEMKQNAAYIFCADAVIYDDEGLFPMFFKNYGPLALGVVLAHEWGHAVQHRTGDSGLPFHTREVQADCYAGAWLAAYRQSDLWDPQEDPDREVSAILAVVAELGNWDIGFEDGRTTNSHGSKFDRVGAILDGREQGLGRCASYSSTPPQPIMPLWESATDAEFGGELAGEELFSVLRTSVMEYWPRKATMSTYVMPKEAYTNPVGLGCRLKPADFVYSFCSEANVVADFSAGTAGAYPDFSYGASLGLAWADAYKSVTRSPAHRACLTGEWVKLLEAGAVPDVALAPGDIDEAVDVMLIADLEPTEDGEYRFDHLTQFKRGYLNGCD